MKKKIVQHLAEVLLDVRKYYNSLNIWRFMNILRGYGLGPNLQTLLQRLWDEQAMVLKAGKLFGQNFGT